MLYKGKNRSSNLCICIIDDTYEYKPWMRELVKNTADYTITNCTGFGYDVYVDTNEDRMLQLVADHYQIAVVISAGTEFINGSAFFDNLPKDFFLLGHILDMDQGYFGLHYQCYVLNLVKYKNIGKPFVGKTELLSSHIQCKPHRTSESVHDEYLPIKLKKHITCSPTNYYHKYRGWNLISTSLSAGLEIDAFDNTLRKSKHYLYRDRDHSKWIYQRYNYCLTEQVFKENTGSVNFPRLYNSPITQMIHPAAGIDWHTKITSFDHAENTVVKFYDYNSKALKEIEKTAAAVGKYQYEFYHVDAIHDVEKFVNIINIDDPQGTVIHMSNVFAYEGTAPLLPLKYRIEKENFLINWAKKNIPDAVLDFDQRAAEGIVPWVATTGLAKDLSITDYYNINLPSWHTYD